MWSYKLHPVLERPHELIIAKDHIYQDRVVKQFKSIPRDHVHEYTQNYYEVIPEKQARRFYIDLDLKTDHDLDDVIKMTTDTIQNILELEFKFTPQYPIVLKVQTQNKSSKKSAHLVYPNLVFEDVTTTRYFATIIKHYIQHMPILKEAIDMNVYGRNQCFRMAYNHKITTSPEYNLVPTRNETMDQTLITTTNQKPTLNYALLVQKAKKCTQVQDARMIPLVFLADNQAQQKQPSPNPHHQQAPSEAAYYLSKIPNSNEHPQSYEIWWSVGQALKNLDQPLEEWIKWSDQASQHYPNETQECTAAWNRMQKSHFGLKLHFLYTLAKARTSAKTPPKDPLTELTDPTPDASYSSRYARPYEFQKPILIHQSAMGSGKTYQIMEHLKENPDVKRVLILSPRRSFSREKVSEFRTLLPDLKDYQELSDTANWSEVPQLAIQVESLHHIQATTDPYDLIIADEIESILFQFSSTTHKNLQDSFTAFTRIMSEAKKVIMADAFVTTRTLEYCKSIRCEYHYEKNTYNPNQHITANIIGIANAQSEVPGLKQAFVEHVQESLRENKKICIVSSSIKFNNEIASTMPKDQVLEYSSESSDQLIKDLENVRTTWSDPKIRCIIYTGVITVGVSYDIPNIFDRIYMYGTSHCPIARDLIQGHFRIRHIKEPNIFIAINGSTTNKQTPTLHNILKFHKIMDQALKYEKEEQDELQQVYNTLAAYNELEESLGKTRYKDVMIHWLEKVGYQIKINTDPLVIIAPSKSPADVISKETYETYKNIKPELIKSYEKLVKKGSATEEVKEKLKVFFFYRNCIEDLTKRAEYPWEYELYTEYRSNVQIKEHVDNIVMELTGGQEKKRYMVQKEKRHLLMLEYVQEVCELLNLKSSYDTETIIRDDALERFKTFYMEKKQLLTNLFRLQTKSKEFKLRQSITSISGIFKSWNGFSLVTLTSQNVKSRNEPNKDYECQLRGKGIVSEYTKDVMTLYDAFKANAAYHRLSFEADSDDE